jgi:RimJ/RimL family protein N-acetyltransferase
MERSKKWKIHQITERKIRKKVFFERLPPRAMTPCFEFITLSPTERLTFEILDDENYLEVFEMFENDINPFVLADYKDLEMWEDYADCQLYWNRMSCKCAGCDWLMKLKTTGQTVGILNLYELSRETDNNKHKKGMIGYSIGQSFRRQHYATEAIKQLISHAFEHFDLHTITANTEKNNLASKVLLANLGFVDETEAYYFDKEYDYFELRR